MNYILRDENAIYYECGYSSDNALFLKLGSEKFLLTDSRYETEARAEVKGTSVLIDRDIYQLANRIIKKSGIKKIVFDPKEWSIFHFNRIQNNLKVKFKQKRDFSHKKRVIKSYEELSLLNRAVKLGTKAFDRFAKHINRGGIDKNEFELTYMATKTLSKKGKYQLSFKPIVAIDKNASKPHALPTNKKLHQGDLLLFDGGLKYKRYCSDRTRTVYCRDNFSFETTQRFKSRKIQKIYDIVLKAHDMAIERAKSGMRGREIDKIARDIITQAGFGDYFIHSTGHGVGLDIHEMPYISTKSETIIEDGMVYTIEPGIYIPNEFGVRIEDMVAMINGRAITL
jgi:Xaa-Pro aminopeptidase